MVALHMARRSHYLQIPASRVVYSLRDPAAVRVSSNPNRLCFPCSRRDPLQKAALQAVLFAPTEALRIFLFIFHQKFAVFTRMHLCTMFI